MGDIATSNALLDPNAWRAQSTQGVTADDINSEYDRNGAHCTAHPNEKNCHLLAPEVRVAVIGDTRDSINAAYAAFLSAVTQVRVDEQLKKPEELSLLAGLVIDALGGLAGMAISRAIRGLRSNPEGALRAIHAGRIGVEDLDVVRAANESNVDLLVSGATSVAKKGMKSGAAASKSAVKADRTDDLVQDKAVADTFASQLETSGAAYFESMRKNVVGSLNDPELILYLRSWDSTNGHTVPAYKAAIESKLARFRSSAASKIGRTEARRHISPAPSGANLGEIGQHALEESDAKDIDRGNDIRDTKLVLRVYDNGVRPQLYYYKRDYHGGIQRVMPSPVGDAFLDPETDLNPVAREDWEPYGEVEPELVDVAMAANEKVWGVKYEPRITASPPAYQKPKPAPPQHAATKAPVPIPSQLDASKKEPIGQDLVPVPGQDLPAWEPANSPVMNID